jgi:putative mRNA 3-end processing factor
LGPINVETLRYGQVLNIGGARVSFHPAGHVPGSAQIRVEVDGDIWVASGDYKIEDDGLSTPFEPVKCHHFITESTFGLPVFQWQPQSVITAQINDWWAKCAAAGQTAFIGAYSLGKAQRLLNMVNLDIGPILTHPTIESTNAVMRDQGISLPQTVVAGGSIDHAAYKRALVIAPPSAVSGDWARRFGDHQTAAASGWLQLRNMQNRRACDQGFVISDHADWNGLLSAINGTGAENIYVTHGYTDIFARYLNENGRRAWAVPNKIDGVFPDHSRAI